MGVIDIEREGKAKGLGKVILKVLEKRKKGLRTETEALYIQSRSQQRSQKM